ncbi:histone H1-like repetitive region-containing protein [Planctomycetaceae bacterium SH139]
MSLTVEQLALRYTRSGLAEPESEAAFQRLLAGFAEAHQETPAKSAAELAKWAVRQGLLTRYQAQQLLTNDWPQLRLGPFVLKSPVETPPLAGWWLTADEQGQSLLVRQFDQPLDAAALRRLGRFQSIANAQLLQVQLPALVAEQQWLEHQQPLQQGQLLLASVPRGKPAALSLPPQGLPAAQVLAIAIEVCKTVAALHEQQLLARPVDANQLWLTSAGSLQLIVDPTLGVEPLANFQAGQLVLSSNSQDLRYSAPECLLMGHAYDYATDLYALGCLLYQLRYGQPPYDFPPAAGANPQRLQQQLSDVPRPLREAVELGASGDPLARVLAHTLAANREARFQSINQLQTALETAASLIEAQPTVTTEQTVDQERAAKELAAKEQAANELAAKELAAKELAAKELAAKELAAKELAAKELAAKELAAKELAAKELAAKELAAKELAAKELAAKELAAKELAAKELAAKELAAKELAAKELAAKELAAKELAAKELAAKELAAKKNAPQELAAEQVAASQPASQSPVAISPVNSECEITVTTRSESVTTRSESVTTAGAAEERAAEPVAPNVKPLAEEVAQEVEGLAKVAVAEGAAVAAAAKAAPVAAAAVPTKRKKPTAVRRKKKKNRAAPIVLGGLGFVIIGLLVALLVKPDRVAETPQVSVRPPLPPPPVVTPPPRETSKPAASAAGTQLVDDDRVLWAAPDQGAPPLLTLLPPGADMLVSFRPDSLLNQETGRAVYQALSPELEDAFAALRKRIRLPWSEIERVTVALEAGDEAGVPRVSLAVDLKQATPIADLAMAWGAEEARTPSGAVAYFREEPGADAYLPSSGDARASEQQASGVSRFAVAEIETLKEIAELEGGAIPLPRQLSKLWQGVGPNPDVAFLVSPNFLFADGRSLLRDYAGRLVSPLRQFLIPAVAGASGRMQFEQSWYVELRFSPGGGSSPASLKQSLDQSLDNLPSAAERFLLETDPHPSWRALAIRWPAMLRALKESTRTGVSDGEAVVNAYLPPRAAPNLLLTSWLASNTPAGPSRGPAPETSGPAALATVDQLLQQPFSISFDQESLEMAGEAIRQQFNAITPPGSRQLEIYLLGGDLQLDGITQNQQIRDFDHQNSPLSKVLDDLVARANPDRTVTQLSEAKQALVWVVGPHPEQPDRQVILITTRTQALAKKYQLPAQFQSAP